MEMSKELKETIGDDAYDFYACYKCGSLITAPQLKHALGTDGRVCGCGSMTIKPTNLRWYHWFLPAVIRFAYLRIMGLA